MESLKKQLTKDLYDQNVKYSYDDYIGNKKSNIGIYRKNNVLILEIYCNNTLCKYEVNNVDMLLLKLHDLKHNYRFYGIEFYKNLDSDSDSEIMFIIKNYNSNYYDKLNDYLKNTPCSYFHGRLFNTSVIIYLYYKDDDYGIIINNARKNKPIYIGCSNEQYNGTFTSNDLNVLMSFYTNIEKDYKLIRNQLFKKDKANVIKGLMRL
jgi:hypothetical protein